MAGWVQNCAAGCIAAIFSMSVAQADSRVAILDTAWDTRPYLSQMRQGDADVLAIGRYYARCAQPERGLTAKRLIDQGPLSDPSSEIAMMSRNGIAVLSVYQYYSNDPNKFLGQTPDGKLLPDASCNWNTAQPRSVEEEARLDAEAALAQARALGQPQGTAIYFGVDFRLDPADTTTQSNLIRYFQALNTHIRPANYRIGAYGSGLTLEILQSQTTASGRGLIDYAWIMASRSFPGSSRFHRSMRWNLFQNQVNREWFGTPSGSGRCSRGLPIDTNVQNPTAGSDIGLWTPGYGPFIVPPNRTQRIFDTRRFACNGDAIVRAAQNSNQNDLTRTQICAGGKHISIGTQVDYANAVRIEDSTLGGHVVRIDLDDDGRWDGWTWHGNLTPEFRAKPDYIFNKAARDGATCP
ncbi:MAG: glycoside hydrolase domain-containing protein [Sulfitobacter sp.]